MLIGDQYEDVAVAQALRRGGVEARTCLFASAPTPTELVVTSMISRRSGMGIYDFLSASGA